jgi:hypothetical protein
MTTRRAGRRVHRWSGLEDQVQRIKKAVSGRQRNIASQTRPTLLPRADRSPARMQASHPRLRAPSGHVSPPRHEKFPGPSMALSLAVQPCSTIVLCSVAQRWKSRSSRSSQGGFSAVTLRLRTFAMAEDMVCLKLVLKPRLLEDNHIGALLKISKRLP